MKYNAHNYQKKMQEFIIEHPAAFLTVDMGLGKTVTTLTAIAELKDRYFEVSKVLVIAPKSVAENTWSSECSKWDHLSHLRISKVMGTPARRKRALEAEADLWVMGRDNVSWLVNFYGSSWPFDMVVLDESSSFKNPQSRRFKALRTVRPLIHRIVLLTGTPSPNGYMDLWSQMWLIDYGRRLGATLSAYRTAFFTPGKHNGHVVYEWRLRSRAEETITRRMSEVTMSLKAEDWLEVPDVIESELRIAMTDQEYKAYRDFEREQLMDIDDSTVMAVTAAALTNKLQQFTGGALYDDEHNWHEVSRVKIDALLDLVESSGSESVLVFYQYKSELARLTEALKDYSPVSFHGEPEILEAWNAGRIRVMLCQPASVQYGLNMQQGGHIIVWYTPTWNLEQYAQANARLHRQGQQQPVLIYHLICEGTIDGLVMKALASKDRAQETLLNGLKLLKQNETTLG